MSGEDGLAGLGESRGVRKARGGELVHGAWDRIGGEEGGGDEVELLSVGEGLWRRIRRQPIYVALSAPL
jgi:hypothetical protein